MSDPIKIKITKSPATSNRGFGQIPWDKFEEVLHKSGWLLEYHTLASVEVDEEGIKYITGKRKRTSKKESK